MSGPCNEDRAAWAAIALHAFSVATGLDRSGDEDECALTDLLCDLMHWADSNGRNFDRALRNAARNHYEECNEEGTSVNLGRAWKLEEALATEHEGSDCHRFYDEDKGEICPTCTLINCSD